MKKLMKQAAALVFSLVLAITFLSSATFADEQVGATITATDTTVGGETKVTVTITGNKEKILTSEIWITYDPTALQIVSGHNKGDGGKVCVIDTEGKNTFTFVFKGLKAGATTVAIGEQTMIGMETTEAKVSASGTVNVKGSANLSKNNNLSALNVSPGNLTPAFSKDVVTYSIVLDEIVDRLTISATPEDTKAKVEVKDAKMDPGDNVTKVIVTAENGDQKVYTIFTKLPLPKEEPTTKDEEMLVDMDGEVYRVVKDLDEKLLPEGYEAAEYTYKKTSIIVGKGMANGKIIFGIQNATVEKPKLQFANYDEQTGNFSPLYLLSVNGATYTPVEDPAVLGALEIPKGYQETSFVIDNTAYRVWVEENTPNQEYCLIYCTNLYGYTGWYQYDYLEGTMQRAFLNQGAITEETEEVTEPVTQETTNVQDESKIQQEFDNYVRKSKISICLLALLLFVVIMIMIIFVIRSFRDPHEEDEEDDDEKIE